MNWILILTIVALVAGTLSAYFSFLDWKKTAITLTIAAACVNGTLIFMQKKEYSSEVPAVTASDFGNVIRIIAVNTDKDLPLKDVSAKVQGQPAVSLGTLYPQVVNVVQDMALPRQNTEWVMVLWYNGNQSLEVNFKVTVNTDSTIRIDTKYINKGVEFTPAWKKSGKNMGDTSAHHYDPALFK